MNRIGRRIGTLAVAAGVLAGGGVLAGAGAAGATTPACGNSSLTVTATFSQGGAGHGWMAVIFRNKTAASCTLHGYPGLDALNSSKHVLAHATRTLGGYGGGAKSVSTITLKPGGYASASVEWLNFNPVTSGDCTFSASIATTPANTSHTVRLPVKVSVCQLQVHPTVAGLPGYPGYAHAQHDWILGSAAISAREGYYWKHAEDYLKAGSATAWSHQIAELKQLISLPDADQTAAQHAKWLADVKDLNAFFVTPGRYL